MAVSKAPDVGRLEVVVKIMTEHKCSIEAKEDAPARNQFSF